MQDLMVRAYGLNREQTLDVDGGTYLTVHHCFDRSLYGYGCIAYPCGYLYTILTEDEDAGTGRMYLDGLGLTEDVYQCTVVGVRVGEVVVHRLDCFDR